MNKILYTLGYEGRNLREFLSILKSNNIHFLIDVRQIANSRKKGFSKSQLEKKLKRLDINYIHFRELGSSKELRDYLKDTDDFDGFRIKYKILIKDTKDKINDLLKLIVKDYCCLLCYEKEATKCHRSLIADELVKEFKSDLNIINL